MSIAELIEKYKPGESELKTYLRGAGYTIEDLSDNPAYWDKDIDLLATNPKTGKTVSIEVKWDKRINETKNLYLETTNPRSKGYKGWWAFCEAEYLYYGDAVEEKFYVFKMDDLRAAVAAEQELNYKTTLDGSCGIAFPLKKAPIVTQFYI